MTEFVSANGSPEIDRAIAEYLMRIDRGEKIDCEEFITTHPAIAAELRAYFADAGFLERMVDQHKTINQAASTVKPMLQEREPGGSLGDYELLGEIARGGMGVVFRARQRSLNRLVAIKMILPGRLANSADVARFHREAQAAASLQHPSIVAIHEVGEHEGRHYFSMDYVDGASLAQMVRESPLPPRVAAEYVRKVCDAIQYAHEQGVLHRDLKPSNVLVDAHNEPRVTDFGLARQVSEDSTLTETGTVLGSPSYMPPEQADGRLDDMGPWSDVYSLGAMLYELLTGRPPFRADVPVKTLLQVLHAEPARPRLLNSAIDRDLETICLKCLEKRPDNRYPSAAALGAELQRFLKGEPILARPLAGSRPHLAMVPP